VNGDLMFRVPEGMSGWSIAAANLKSHEVEIRMNTRVSDAEGAWRSHRGNRSADSSAAETIRAQQAVITVFACVLKASPNDIGGIRSRPICRKPSEMRSPVWKWDTCSKCF